MGRFVFILFAQPEPSHGPLPISPSLTDPGKWGELAGTPGVGFAGMLVIFLLAIGVVMGIMFWWSTVGPKGYIRKGNEEANAARVSLLDELKTSVVTLRESFVTTQDSHKSQLAICRQVHSPGGVGNVQDLRVAGHAAANALGEIGEAVKADVQRHVDAIHSALDASRGVGQSPIQLENP